MRKYICGKNSVYEALENHLPIKKVLVQNNQKISLPKHIDVEFVPKKYLETLVKNQHHQGLVAILDDYNFFDLKIIFEDKPNKILILDHIQDPQNFGAILRIANAAGVKHIIIAKNRQVDITPTVLKVSSGGYVGLKIIKVNNLTRSILELKKANFWIYGTTIEKAISYKKIEFNKPFALIFGNEQKGISPLVLKQVDQNVSIPMQGTVQSLNVAVSVAILLFYCY